MNWFRIGIFESEGSIVLRDKEDSVSDNIETDCHTISPNRTATKGHD